MRVVQKFFMEKPIPVFISNRDIKIGEELTYNYGGRNESYPWRKKGIVDETAKRETSTDVAQSSSPGKVVMSSPERKPNVLLFSASQVSGININ